MTSMFVSCVDCGKSIDPQRDYRQVTGWERPRNAGGLHALKDRVETGRWIHRDCYDLRHLHGQTMIF
jgi:hypothetical protein